MVLLVFFNKEMLVDYLVIYALNVLARRYLIKNMEKWRHFTLLNVLLIHEKLLDF